MTTTVEWAAEMKAVSAGKERKALYARYLESAAWKATRRAALERAEGTCQVCCSAKRLQVHHRTYERVGAERPADLIVLCEKCHALFHGKKSGGRREPKKNKRLRDEAHRTPRAGQAPPRPETLASVDEAIAGVSREEFTTGMIRNRIRRDGPLPSTAVVRRCILHRVSEGRYEQISKNRFKRAS